MPTGKISRHSIDRWQTERKKELASTNLILSKNARISYNTKKTEINNNIIVVGGPGTGKSAAFRIITPEIKMYRPFETWEQTDLRTCFEAIQELADLAAMQV